MQRPFEPFLLFREPALLSSPLPFLGIGILFGWFALRIEDDSWIRWGLIMTHLPGKQFRPPMFPDFFMPAAWERAVSGPLPTSRLRTLQEIA